MAFWKDLFKKSEPEPVPTAHLDDFPELFSGMQVEVLAPAGVSLCKGKIRLLTDNQLDLFGEAGGYLPRALYNQPVSLRCFQRDGQSFLLNGTVSANSRKFWRIERLQYPQNAEKRNFFRQDINAEAFIRASSGQRFPCKVLDISGGGVRILTEKLFPLETTVQLEATLLPTEDPFAMPCLIKRINVRSQPANPVKKFEYGCQFVDVPQREQERLFQSIFTLQRKALRARKG